MWKRVERTQDRSCEIISKLGWRLTCMYVWALTAQYVVTLLLAGVILDVQL